jgi:hypothetical protein
MNRIKYLLIPVCIIGLLAVVNDLYGGEKERNEAGAVAYGGVSEEKTIVDESMQYIGFDWSDDGKYFMKSEYSPDDQRIHLCIYSTESLEKEKCVFALHKDRLLREVQIPQYFIRDIDWSGERVYFEESFDEVSLIFWISIANWKEPDFEEIDGDDENSIVYIEHSGISPAWDKKNEILYFLAQEELGEGIGIIMEKNNEQSSFDKYGSRPYFDGKYLWYPVYPEGWGGDKIGIVKCDPSTKEKEMVTSGLDWSVSASDEEDILFIRTMPVPDTAKDGDFLYLYKSNIGEKGPLYGQKLKDNEDIERAKISPDGRYALILVSKQTKEEIHYKKGDFSYDNLGVTRYKLERIRFNK